MQNYDFTVILIEIGLLSQFTSAEIIYVLGRSRPIATFLSKAHFTFYFDGQSLIPDFADVFKG